VGNFTLAALKQRFDQETAQAGKVTIDQQVLADRRNLAFVATMPGAQLVLINARTALDQSDVPHKLTVVGNPEIDWMIQGVNGAGLTAISIALTYDEIESKAADSTMAFEGTLTIGEHPVVCTGSAAEKGGLKFALKEGQAITAPLTAVGEFVAGSRMSPRFLPTGVKIFTEVPITAIELTFGFSDTSPTLLQVSSDVGGPWDFIEGVDLEALKNVGLRLFCTYGASNQQFRTSYGGDIHADFAFGGPPLEARLALNDGDIWEIVLGAKPGGTLPGLVDLAESLGEKEPVQTALHALGLGDISVQGVAIGFNLNDRKLLYFTILGRVRIVDTDFDLWIRLPNFQFGGGLATGSIISFRTIADHFFSASQNLPDVIVEEFSVSAQPSMGTYSLTVALSEEGFALGPLKLDGLNFFIEKTPQGFDGSMNATMEIAQTTIQVTVSHPSPGEGWQFEGGTTASGDIPVSKFLTDTIDTLFPGSPPSKSNVPSMLDVAIKSFDIQFNTKTKDFHFDTDINFGKNVETILTFSNLYQEGTQPPTFEKRATGVIKILPGTKDEFEFELVIDLKPDSKHFVALYKNTSGRSLDLGALVKSIFPDADLLKDIPKFSITIKDVIAGYVSDQTVSQSIFALDIGASIDLTSLGDIPLIGKTLSAAKALTLAFQFVYSAVAPDKKFAIADLVALNNLITVAGPKFPADKELSGFLFKAELRMGDGDPIDFNLPVTVDNSTGQLVDNGNPFPPPSGAQRTNDEVNWFQLNKNFGPIHLQRAGFKFEKGEVTVLLDGGLAAFGLEVDLMGLSVSSKINDVKDGKFDPQFGLQGLGLSFSKGGLGFAGALLRLQVIRNNETVYEYDGLASVEAEGLLLAAIGSLTTEVNDQPSLFLYAVLDYPLGGAPFFYVTGLAGGFGLNQKLTMPTVDQVQSFPLIDAALHPPSMPTDAGSAGPFITQEMQKLHTYLTPSLGQYFGCAGVRFTSFELLDSFVLVCISFGSEFELDLLGMSTLIVPSQLPTAEPALAQVSLQIVASFIPSEGFAIVQGRLTTDSYIIDPKCHLTGGFAFATWFGPNPNAGDFVITLGGYHPDFQKPTHYPTVPRVGINWQISSELSVTGGLYFALTPRALMAGGAMRAVFQTSLDLDIATVDVKAWFIMGADFIVYWKPFHYSADLYIDIGIDVVIHFLGTHDLGLDAGADLQVWGPAFGGHAHVFVKVIGIKIGFDVDFGAHAPAPPPLEWDNDQDASKSFRKSFLPPNDKIVSVVISEGLVRKVDLGNEGNGNGQITQALGGVAPPLEDNQKDVRFVINPTDFCVRTSSVIPIKECTTAIPPDQRPKQSDVPNTVFGIAPMNMGNGKVKTSHLITVTCDGKSAESEFVLRPILNHVPGGLWAENNSADINAEPLIENALVGFEIVPGRLPVPGHTQSIDRSLLKYTTHDMDKAYVDNAINTFSVTGPHPGDDPSANLALWDRIQGEIHGNATREEMLAAMGFAKNDLDIGETFSTDAAYAPNYGLLSR